MINELYATQPIAYHMVVYIICFLDLTGCILNH